MRLLNNIRYAGKRLLDMDEAYSKSIVNMHLGPESNPRKFGNTFQNAMHTAGAIWGGGAPIRGDAPVFDKVTGVASKYGAPIAGVTLAGKGIYDLATRGQESSAEDDERYRR